MVYALGLAIESGAAVRIDAACFTQDDGFEDRWDVEFWALSGSIIRSCYDRRSTVTVVSFVPLGEAFDRLLRLAAATFYQI